MSRKCVVKFVVKVVLLHKGPPTFNTLKTEGPHGNCGVATQSVWWDKRCRLALQGTVHHLRRRTRCLWISTRCANQCFRFHWFGSLWECALHILYSSSLAWVQEGRDAICRREPTCGAEILAVLHTMDKKHGAKRHWNVRTVGEGHSTVGPSPKFSCGARWPLACRV
jgi:hypothetical protein